LGGFWLISDRESLQRVMRDTDSFVNRRTEYTPEGTIAITLPPRPAPFVAYPDESDPPLWKDYRAIVNEVLSRQAVEALRPVVERWTEFLIDRVIAQGSCDLMHDLASPMPACVMLEFLGFPTDSWDRYSRALHDIHGYPPGSERFDEAVRGMSWIEDQIREIVPDRRSSPRDDVVSHFLQQEVDGRPLDDDQVMSIVFNVLAGGLETSASGIGSALMHLSTHEQDRQRLIDEPELMDVAVEECLRFYPPVPAMARTVMQDTTVGGCEMKRGERLLFSLLSANRDETFVPEPNTFIVDRTPNRHVTFGLGIHHCVGLHLARLEMRTCLTQVLDRIPDFTIDPATAKRYLDMGGMYGWFNLPATFTPGRPGR
jgi:cytochrome P450